MGLKYGIGYCICTDWHFQARRALGYIDTEGSYIDFILRLAVGWTPDPAMTRTMAGVVFTISIVLSVALNIRDRSQQKGKSNLGITVI